MDSFTWYLIIINIFGFLCYFINFLLYKHTKRGQIDLIVTIASLLGGSFGIGLFFLFLKLKIDILFEHSNDQEYILLGDQMLLTRMIFNLMENAIHYGKEGGHVWVKLSWKNDIMKLIIYKNK